MVTCPWCSTSYRQFQSSCDRCGGPLPPAPGDDPGPLPAPPYRRPDGFKPTYTDLSWVSGLAIMAASGIIFCGLSFFCFPPFFFNTPPQELTIDDYILFGFMWLLYIMFLGVSVVAMLLGVSTIRKSMNHPKKIDFMFQRGKAVTGEITQTYRNSEIKVGLHPAWTIVYSFEASGRQWESIIHTGDISTQKRKPGEPVHVIYLPEDPRYNTIYPPFK